MRYLSHLVAALGWFLLLTAFGTLLLGHYPFDSLWRRHSTNWSGAMVSVLVGAGFVIAGHFIRKIRF
jgi:hypothetical protein